MLRKNLLLLALSVCFTQLYAQRSFKKRLPAARTPQEYQLGLMRNAQPSPVVFGKTGITMPPNVRYPGEFEESQAVAISWANDYDNLGNIIGVDTIYEEGWISAQLAKYISDEIPVWIRVPFAKDTATVLRFMNSLGWPLTNNYRFFVTDVDAWWMRDYGPNGIYYSSKDSVGFVDTKYYSGRDFDDVFPAFLASKTGIKNIVSKLNIEGGNLMSDGFGKVFFSSVVTTANADISNHNPIWDSTATTDTVKNIFNATQLYNLKTLQCDGGTGHIDLYLKLVDEQTMLVAQYPSVVTAIDKQIIEDNYQKLAILNSTYNRPFRIYRIPMPTGDDGTYSRKNCSQIDFDARTFINGTTLNKTFIYPSYSNTSDGNAAQTQQVTSLYKKIMPGYKVIPVDSRVITTNGGGGAIHCITMQIPANNPVLFWHPSIDGPQFARTSFPIIAKITNNSGITSAICKWKKRGTTMWSTFNLTDSSGYFVGNIPCGTVTLGDSIDYYLQAVTVNGKTAVKPITAPDGFYTIAITSNLSVNDPDRLVAKNHLFAAYPNPSSSQVTVPFYVQKAGDVSIEIYNLTGQMVYRKQMGNLTTGMYNDVIDTRSFANGVYLYSYILDGVRIDSRKLTVAGN